MRIGGIPFRAAWPQWNRFAALPNGITRLSHFERIGILLGNWARRPFPDGHQRFRQ